jgi:hypothetical protein
MVLFKIPFLSPIISEWFYGQASNEQGSNVRGLNDQGPNYLRTERQGSEFYNIEPPGRQTPDAGRRTPTAEFYNIELPNRTYNT